LSRSESPVLQSAQSEHVEQEVERKDDSVSDYSGNEELLLSVINNIRMMFLNRKTHIKEYYKIRKMHSEVSSAMAQAYFDGKFKQEIDRNYIHHTGSKENSATGNKSLPVIQLLDASFNMDTEEGERAFFDMLIYKPAPNINCITESFISKHRYRKPEKIELLNSMLNSRLGLFEVISTDINEGYAYVKEVFTGDEYKLTDIGLSGGNDYQFYMYTRIITYHGISFTSGLNFIFEQSDSFIKDHIQHYKRHYSKEGELVRFIQLYNWFSENPGAIKPIFTKI
jgi:hypothetical protein